MIAVAHFLIVEMGGSVMQTVPLSSKQWVMCVGVGMLSLVWGGAVVQPLSLAFFGPPSTLPSSLRNKKHR